ncbi:MAG: hypothetical protein KC589_04515 [Nanoarchaeota archaeon]|nr:hypothetical protein [Nanoarchaeota archaeon]
MTITNLFRREKAEVEQPEQESPLKTFDQKLEELAQKYIGTQRAFREGTIPLYSEERTGRIFREILGIEIKGNNNYSVQFGDELILGRDIEVMEGDPEFKIIAPYQTGHFMVDTTLKAVELGNLVGCAYVFPNESGEHLMGQGFKFRPYLINRKS